MEHIEEINDINDKLVELYGKLIRIKYRLDTLEGSNVKAKSINQFDTNKSPEQGNVQASKRPNK